MLETTIPTIVMATERADIAGGATAYLQRVLPAAMIETVSFDAIAEAMDRPAIPGRLLAVALNADSEGHLEAGTPYTENLVRAHQPVLVLRQANGGVSLADQSAPTRVVVPLDGSSLAGQAVPVAIRMAHALHLPVHFVMVIDPSRVIPPAYAYDPDAWGMIEQLRTTAHWALTQAEQTVKNENIAVTADLMFGPINATLSSCIQDGDIVVMATHGPDQPVIRPHESVATRVLLSTAQPMLIMQGDRQQDVVVSGHLACSWVEPLKRRQVS